jgi:AraC-like DNA-binding protein
MYAEHPPFVPLRAWVESFWTRPAFAAEAPVTQRVLPDGCADVIFDLTNGRALAVGTMTTPLVITAAEGPELFGVRFRPGRASAFFGMPLDELTDQTIEIPLDAEPFAGGERIARVEEMLMRRLAAADVDARIDGAVTRIEASRGLVSIEQLATDLGITRQHLRRRFLERVGISPKMFARVVRFQQVVARSTRAPNLSWAGLAADFGYSDQSHLIADFRALAGTTPVPFLLSRETGAP